MAKTIFITREALIALVDMHYAARANDEDFAFEVPEGVPANAAFAEQLRGDFICALEDGTIAAWGSDIARGGYTDRELVFIAPAEQIVAHEDEE